MRPYFPSSSNSWYSSVNLVQIVNAILTEVPSGCAETQKRCSYWRHARSSTPPGFTLQPQAERRIHAQLKRIGAPTGWVVFLFVFWVFLFFLQIAPLYAGPFVWAGDLSTLPVAVFSAVCSQAGSCQSSCAQHFVCIPAPLLHIRPALWRLVSERASDAALAHLPPRQALSPAPLLASSRRAVASEAERMKKKNRNFGQW